MVVMGTTENSGIVRGNFMFSIYLTVVIVIFWFSVTKNITIWFVCVTRVGKKKRIKPMKSSCYYILFNESIEETITR